MKAKRSDLNLNRVIQNLLRGLSYTEIADEEARHFDGATVGRGLIAGIARDLKNGSLTPSAAGINSGLSTYVYGVEQDNGGMPLFIGHPVLEEDAAIVISDIHIPKTRYDIVDSVNKSAVYYGAKTLIIAGDLFDFGSQARFKRKVRPTPTSEDFRISRDMMAFFLEKFKSVKFIPGNHDDWFLENQEGNLTVTDLARLSVNPEDFNYVEFYAYDRMTLISSGIEWVIPHQSDSSVYSLKVAEQLSTKFHANVVVPHQHNTALGYDRYNRYVLADIGGLHDRNLMDYVSLKTSVAAIYDNGYAAIIDGAIELIVPDDRHMVWRRLN